MGTDMLGLRQFTTSNLVRQLEIAWVADALLADETYHLDCFRRYFVGDKRPRAPGLRLHSETGRTERCEELRTWPRRIGADRQTAALSANHARPWRHGVAAPDACVGQPLIIVGRSQHDDRRQALILMPLRGYFHPTFVFFVLDTTAWRPSQYLPAASTMA